MDFLSLLSAPIPYLEQEQYDFCEQDSNGYTSLHFAMLTMNFDWLQSALAVNKDNFIKNLSTNSKYNSIPTEFIPELGQSKKSKQNIANINSSIPFGKKGYSVVHLLIWLMHHYEHQTHINKTEKINELVTLFNSWMTLNADILKIKDGNGVSMLEYIIMLNQENILEPYIDLINSADFCPKLTDETIEKLINTKDTKNKNIRFAIFEKISSCRKKNEIDKTFEQHMEKNGEALNLINDNEDECDFKI